MDTEEANLSQDGFETIEDVSTGKVAAEEDQAQVLLNLEELIKSNLASTDKLSEELKKQRQMFEDAFESDPVYREHMERVKEATKVKNETRAQLMRQPQLAQLSEKIKGLRAEIKDKKLSLSEYVKEYYQMTGVNEIEGEDGEVREIIPEFRLVRKLQK